MKPDVSLLFVGLGSIGMRHLQNAKELGVTDIRAWRSGASASGAVTPPGILTYEHLEDALADRPTAVVICNPTSRHLPVALAAAEAGSHLFIEKPLSHSLDGLDRLLALVRQGNLLTLMGLTLRFHPALRSARHIIDSGALGRVVSVRAEVGQYLPDWRPTQDYRLSYSARRELGGGVLLDLIHEIDYVNWLGGGIESVMCQSAKLTDLELDTEDVADLLVRFKSSALGSIHLDYVQRCPTRRCMIIGTEGTLDIDLLAPEVRLGRPNEGWRVDAFPSFARNDMFLAQMTHFLAVLAHREQTAVGLEDGIRLQQIVAAAHKSSNTARLEQVSDRGPDE